MHEVSVSQMRNIIVGQPISSVKAMYRDILVIGAGAIGLSSALHLKRLNPEKTVMVVDRLGGPGQGNTAKCAGIFLNLATAELNFGLCARATGSSTSKTTWATNWASPSTANSISGTKTAMRR